MSRSFSLNALENLPAVADPNASLAPLTATPVIIRPKQTSPFVNIPTEILLRILKMAVVQGTKGNRSDPLPLPVIFSHISSYVRSAVLEDPFLWTTMDNSVFRSGALIDAYLIRSQMCLIDIIMDGFYRRPVVIIKKLMTHIHRWRGLRLFVHGASVRALEKVLLCLHMQSAPNLLLTP
jgi:hypothetical protein